MARKLFQSAGFSSTVWGHQGSGISDSHLRWLESRALSATGIPKPGRCKTIALIFSYWCLGTPAARIIRETVTAWSDVLKDSDPQNIDRISKAWDTVVYNCTYNNKTSFFHVCGLLSNVVHMLFRLERKPRKFDEWESKNGDVWKHNAEAHPHGIINEPIHDMQSQRLRSASLHHNGAGLETGIDRHATFALYRPYDDNDDLYPYKCALESIMSASTWSSARVHCSFKHVSPLL